MRSVLLVLLAVTPPFAQEPRPRTPKDEYEMILNDYKSTSEVFFDRNYEAKTEAAKLEVARALQPKMVEFASRFLDLARKYPKDDVAFDALIWVVSNRHIGVQADEAVERLIAEHIQSPRMAQQCDWLSRATYPTAERLLLAIIEKHPDRQVRGQASLSLAKQYKTRSEIVRQITSLPAMAKRIEAHYDKAAFEEIKRGDPDTWLKKAEAQFERTRRQFPDVPMARPLTGAELFEIRELAIGKLAPEIDGEDLDGRKMKLSDYRGKVVMLSFWATWCGPCMEMIPHERALVKKLEGRPFALLGINGDHKKVTIRKRIEKEEVTWRSWWGDGPEGPIPAHWNVVNWPTIYVLDAAGVIRYKSTGFKAKELDDAIDKVLGESGPSGDSAKPPASR